MHQVLHHMKTWLSLCARNAEKINIVQFQGRELINGARIGSVPPLIVKLMQGGFYGVQTMAR